MKRVILIGAIGFVLFIAAVLFVGFSEPPEGLDNAIVTGSAINEGIAMEVEKIPLNPEDLQFNFEGYGPGKEHLGTFTNYKGNLHIEENELVGVDFTIDASSVEVGISRLNNHLQSDDFFDVEKFPEIKFTSTLLSEDRLEGDLLFRGVTKHLSIPVTREDSKVSADFLLDVTEFEFKYIGINKDVRIMFKFSE